VNRAPAVGQAPPVTRQPQAPPAIDASGTGGLDPER
jgi:hypothetical protein